MKVLHRMHTLKTLPILKPHQLLHFLCRKRLLHIGFNLLFGFFCAEARDGVVVELEFRPDD
jgi:hypothetical protein